MKISFCTIGFQKNKWGADHQVERPLAEILPIIASAGYDGVEIWGEHIMTLGGDRREEVRRQLRGLRLGVAQVSPYFNFTKSEEHAAASVEQGLRVIQVARELEARSIRVFTGGPGSAEATEEQWQRTFRSLRTLCDAGGGVLFSAETHKWNLMDSIEGTLRLVRGVNRPNFKVIYQPSTFGGQYLAALEALKGHIAHVHATNSKDGKGALLGEGTMLDYEAIVKGLKGQAFDGYISVEWMGSDPEAVARREAEYLRGLIARC